MVKQTLFFSLFLFSITIVFSQNITIQKIGKPELDSVPPQKNNELVLDFEVLHNSGCESLITQLINHVQYPFEDSLAFFWTLFNDNQTVSLHFDDDNPDIFINEPGNYHIKLVISDAQGFTDSIIKHNVITVDKMPQIDFTFTPENALFAEYLGVVEFTNLTDTKLLKDNSIVWFWELGDGEINSNEWSPVHLFSSWGDYHTTFHLKTKNGCKVALTKTITIEDELFFSDTLFKNATGISSIFAITNLNTSIAKDDPNEFRTNYLFIYNAHGEKIYEQTYYDTYIKKNQVVKGKYLLCAADLQEGVYYYSFFYKGKSKMVHYKGEFWVM